MTSKYRHRRTSDPTIAFPNPIEPGEIAVNTANRQIVVGDAAGGAIGSPLPLLAIRFFSDRAIYNVDDMVAYNGNVYRANVSNGPGAFDPVQWTAGGTQLFVADTPPLGVLPGSFWWSSDEGVLYLLYDDGTSTQWVIASPQPDISVFVQKAGDSMAGPLLVPWPSQPGHAANKSYVDAQDAVVWENTVAKAGDVMSGDLTITKADAVFIANKPAASVSHAGIQGMADTKMRWFASLANAIAETGANTGSNFSLYYYADDGSFLGTALTGIRATGMMEVKANPTTPLGISTKQYADSKVAKAGDTMSGPLRITGATNDPVLFARSDLPQGNYACAMYVNYQGGGNQYGISMRGAADGANAITFNSAANVAVGAISTNASTTVYGTGSDARLKEDGQSFDAGVIIDQINVYDFRWKSTGAREHGVYAQEVQPVYSQPVIHQVAPPAAEGAEKETPEDWWGVDYSKFVPLLLQEVKALRARVAQLEGA